jgi:hypothetical protein
MRGSLEVEHIASSGAARRDLGSGVPPASQVLAVEAARLVRIRKGVSGSTPRWWSGAASRQVALIVEQLRPIRSRAALASSFEREANPSDDIRLAYAVVWLELGRTLSATTTRRRRAAAVIRHFNGRR